MRKVYLPVYLIEWSDIRPYAIMVAHGLKVAAIYIGKAFLQLALWIKIAAPYVWRAIKQFFIWLFHLLLTICKGVWNMFKSIFTVANPRNEEDDDDDNAYSDSSYSNEDDTAHTSSSKTPRSLFDGED